MQHSVLVKNRARLQHKTRKFVYRRRFHYDDFSISPETLAMMDASMRNFKAGIVFGPIDLSEFDD